MKKLIEFQEDKHREVLDAVEQYREENGTTFSEAVRRLIIQGHNGSDTPEACSEPSKVEELEDKFEKLHAIVKKHLEKHTEDK